MDFEFSEEQEMLRASVRAFLVDKSPIGAVRAAYDIDTLDRSVWDGLAALGVLDLEMVDAAVVLEELGRAVCPAPYASSVIGARWLLPELTSIGTVAIYETDTRYAWRSPATLARPDGPGWRLDGQKQHVPDAATAEVFLVTARDPDGRLGVFATEDATAGGSRAGGGARDEGARVPRNVAAR